LVVTIACGLKQNTLASGFVVTRHAVQQRANDQACHALKERQQTWCLPKLMNSSLWMT